jgi:AraC-like DNA-binding protein
MRSQTSLGSQARPLPEGVSWHSAANRTGRCDFFWHAHQVCELIVFFDGFCNHRVGTWQGRGKTPVAFLLGPGVPHAFWTEGFLPNGESLAFDLTWFDQTVIQALDGRAPEAHELAPLWSGMRRGLRFVGTPALLVHERLRGIAGLAGLRGLAAILDVLALLAAHQGEALHPEPADGAIDDRDLDRLTEVESWLRARFREDVTLPQCAAACGMGVSTLNALLKRHYQQTFLDFLSEIRLQHAVEALKRDDRDILDIALANGFGSIATFNRRFRRAYGLAPQEWRERHR